MILYAILISLIAVIILRVLILKKQRKVSDEKIHFFINTAHDIRTPLTLIKAPLEDLREKRSSEQGRHSQHEHCHTQCKCLVASDNESYQL